MPDQFSRTALQFGADAMERLFSSKVAIFGIGGVGGYAAEALARTGVGAIDLFDDDKICLTNINRQIIATHRTVGKYKADVMRERILDINPKAQVGAFKMFYLPSVSDDADLSVYDYIIDAVDTITAKIELVTRALACGSPVISAMGAANKLDPSAFEVADIYETSVCPMAKVMRKELRKRGVRRLKTVYSKEPASKPLEEGANSCSEGCVCPPGVMRTCLDRRSVPASNAFTPPVMGFILAGEVIKDIAFGKEDSAK